MQVLDRLGNVARDLDVLGLVLGGELAIPRLDVEQVDDLLHQLIVRGLGLRRARGLGAVFGQQRIQHHLRDPRRLVSPAFEQGFKVLLKRR